jgi:xanthine/uracil permease
LDAVTIVMETGFALTGFIGVILNLIMPQDEVENVAFTQNHCESGEDEPTLPITELRSEVTTEGK